MKSIMLENEFIDRFKKEKLFLMRMERDIRLFSKVDFYFDESIERFIEYIRRKEIDVVYYMYTYYEMEEFIITEENAESIGLSNDEYLEYIDEIAKYNKKVETLPFDKPNGLLIFVVNQGVVWGKHCRNAWLAELIDNDEICEDSDIALERIIDPIDDVDYEEEIEIRQRKKYAVDEEKEKQVKKELFEFFLNDGKFMMCTNKELRIKYSQSFPKYNPSLTKKVESICSVKFPDHLPYVTGQFLRNIVEMSWKIIKSGCKSSEEAVEML